MDCCLAAVDWKTWLWTIVKQVSYHISSKTGTWDNASQGESRSVTVLANYGVPGGVDKGGTPEGTHPSNKCGLFYPSNQMHGYSPFGGE